jgi:hypothetical protein
MLAHRLTQLCETLENLGARLRGTIANVIGETVGFVIRDTALRILDEVTQYFPAGNSLSSPVRGNDQDKLAWRQHEDERGYWDDEDEVSYEPIRVDRPTPPAPPRLPTALSAGLQAASWWLRRWPGRKRLITTVAFGLIATSAAYFGGPLVIAMLGLMHAATHFTSMSGAFATRDINST